MQGFDRWIAVVIASLIVGGGCKEDSRPPDEPPPQREERLFPEDLSERACELLTKADVAEVAGVEASAVSLSDINAEHQVVTECLYFWGATSVRRSARVFDIQVADTARQAREQLEAAVAEEHPRRDLRAVSELGDAAYWNAARFARHTKDPVGERSSYANEVWVRVGNLRLRVGFRNGRLDTAYKEQTLALARAVLKRLSRRASESPPSSR